MPPAPNLFNGKASKNRGETKIDLTKSIFNNGIIITAARIEVSIRNIALASKQSLNKEKAPIGAF